MLDESIAAVRVQNLTSDPAIREALLKQVKLYNYIPSAVENHYAEALVEEYRKSGRKQNRGIGQTEQIMTKIEYSTGCAKCKRLFANAEQAVMELKITAEVVKVENLAEIVGHGVMLPPALFINGEKMAERPDT